ncbi:acyl-CoA synthetase [Nocardioides speluncae]|uniref:acyl-CoA synthetase n=1 Tax=Nocardioides speluncae TaxID=2670337 RepID=UPI000D689D1F|nr:acyl-CoA synthetase [Nocardioides speluncae]
MEMRRTAGRVGVELKSLQLAVRSGLLGPVAPHRLPGVVGPLRRYGMLGALPGMGATKHPDRLAVIDERGTLTYGELDARSNALANAWRERGLRPRDGVAILARNHRGFVEAYFAAAKCGAKVVLLNTDFSGPQLREVADREGTDLLVYDDEYAEILAGVEPRYGRYRCWVDEPGADDADTIDALIAASPTTSPPAPGVEAKIVLLTSGTTGTPKGAPRPEPRSLAPIGGLLSRIPFKSRGITVVPAPLFHTLGFGSTQLAFALGSTIVIRRRFDPALVVDDVARHRATGMVVVPVMLQRMVDLGPDAFSGKDLSALKIIMVAGSQLGADLAQRVTASFGPVIHNLYGSTEVAYATVAMPDDIAAEPGCVGRPVLGTIVKILDENGAELPTGRTGRIFVGNSFQFEGYTGGGGKEMIDGLMSTGDVGHFDINGRLFVDGRDDDMIVSGGENVFPGEVEELLVGHDAVREVATMGAPDEKFGQRLRAFVVLHEGAELSADEVRDYVRDNLARYKVPRDVVFLDELPRNPTGKVLKRKLAELGS